MDPFFELLDVPTNSCVLLDTRAEAERYARGDIVLAHCRACGFIANVAFDPRLAEYSARYEGTQRFSPTFDSFHRRLAAELLARRRTRDRDVLEIGCGDGEFLALLCELGRNRGLGFDPSYDGARGILTNLPQVQVVRDFYSDDYADVRADLVCSKMTLEHIRDTAAFVRLMRGALRDSSSAMFVMVPNALRILKECAFEDIYYEHCSYFTAGSLTRLLEAEGLEVLGARTEYQEQYLLADARLADAGVTRIGGLAEVESAADLAQVRSLVESFQRRVEPRLNVWRGFLEERRGADVALWGSGSKAAAFLNAVDPGGVIGRVVDVNPHKHGHFMPGSGQPIVSPESLRDRPPDTVVMMNRVYAKEISDHLASMGLEPELDAL